MALNSLYCADVPLSNYSLTQRQNVGLKAVDGDKLQDGEL